MSFSASLRRFISRSSHALHTGKAKPSTPTETTPLLRPQGPAGAWSGPQPWSAKVRPAPSNSIPSMAPRSELPRNRVTAFSTPQQAQAPLATPLNRSNFTPAAYPASHPASPSGPKAWPFQSSAAAADSRFSPVQAPARNTAGPVGLQTLVQPEPAHAHAVQAATVAPHRPAGDRKTQVQAIQDRITHLEGRLERNSERWKAARAEYNRLYKEAFTAPDDHPVHAKLDWMERRLGKLENLREKLLSEISHQRSELASFYQPRAEKLAASLRELASVQGPQRIDVGGLIRITPDGQAFVDPAAKANRDHLRDHAHLRGKEQTLARDRDRLHRLLGTGVLDGLPPAQLAELKQLAAMDMAQQFARLERLADSVQHRDAELRKRTSGGFVHSVPTTAAQRAEAERARLQAAQDALDNGYR
jgi:hypothetical protein